MNKSLSIFGVTRPSLMGDIIVSLVFPNYLEKVFPDSYKCAYIDRKCWQITPFLINHPLINQIKVSEEPDKITQNDANFINKFDLKFHPFPQHPYGENNWFNERSIIHETFLMNFVIGQGYIEPSEWNKLTEEDKIPRLYQYFPVEKQNKTVAIWAKSGYSNNDETIDLRSPKNEFWQDLIVDLNKMGYKCLLFGHPKSDYIDGTVDCRNMSLFDAVKMSLGCDFSITTDSGASWIINAYGANNITLYTNYKQDHYQKLDSFVPVNWRGNMIAIYGLNKNINNINKEEILDKVGDFR